MAPRDEWEGSHIGSDDMVWCSCRVEEIECGAVDQLSGGGGILGNVKFGGWESTVNVNNTKRGQHVRLTFTKKKSQAYSAISHETTKISWFIRVATTSSSSYDLLSLKYKIQMILTVMCDILYVCYSRKREVISNKNITQESTKNIRATLLGASNRSFQRTLNDELL